MFSSFAAGAAAQKRRGSFSPFLARWVSGVEAKWSKGVAEGRPLRSCPRGSATAARRDEVAELAVSRGEKAGNLVAKG